VSFATEGGLQLVPSHGAVDDGGVHYACSADGGTLAQECASPGLYQSGVFWVRA
jgi:hypothetical protein